MHQCAGNLMSLPGDTVILKTLAVFSSPYSLDILDIQGIPQEWLDFPHPGISMAFKLQLRLV